MAILQLWQFRRLRNDSHPLPHPSKDVQRLAQLVFRMGSGHDGPQAGFAFRYSGVGDAWSEYAFLEELAAELHGQAAFANHDRRNWRFADRCVPAADVESQIAQFLFEKACIVPELFHELRLLLQHVESCD